MPSVRREVTHYAMADASGSSTCTKSTACAEHGWCCVASYNARTVLLLSMTLEYGLFPHGRERKGVRLGPTPSPLLIVFLRPHVRRHPQLNKCSRHCFQLCRIHLLRVDCQNAAHLEREQADNKQPCPTSRRHDDAINSAIGNNECSTLVREAGMLGLKHVELMLPARLLQRQHRG